MRYPDTGLPSNTLAAAEPLRDAPASPAPPLFMRPGARVLDSHIDALSWDDCLAHLTAWAAQRESRCITFCNVHSVVTASESPDFHDAIAQADLALPDGAPVAWVLRHQGFPKQPRLNGPDLMWRYLSQAAQLDHKVFFYGSTPETLDSLRARLATTFPGLQIAGMVSPPFRALSTEEDQAAVDQINQSGANVVFVGLGCPKQELWMVQHKGRVHAVMLGVGAAFDYHAGNVKRAPRWMQRHGLEWLHRLFSEPRRLLKRYGYTNCVFLARIARDAWLGKRAKHDQAT